MKNILEEYDAVKNDVGLFDFSMEGKVIVTGTGRLKYINDIVSNDIVNLNDNNGIYAAFLDKFGKVLSDCVIYKFKDFLLLNMSIVGKNNIITNLKNNASLVKSNVEDATLKYGLFSFQGPKSLELLKVIINEKIELKNQYQCIVRKIKINNINNNQKNSKLNNNKNNVLKLNNSTSSKYNNENNPTLINQEIEIIISNNKRTTEDGYDVFVPSNVYKEFKDLIITEGKNYNLKLINNETYNILRLEAKIPLYGIDFDKNNIMPEITEKAISYEKGCFLGQEIVARIKNLGSGLTSKKLVSIEIDGKNLPEKNTELVNESKKVGYITSAAYSPTLNKVVALGFLDKGFYENNIELIIEIDNQKVKCRKF